MLVLDTSYVSLFTARGWGRRQERLRFEQAWADAVGADMATQTRVGGLQPGRHFLKKTFFWQTPADILVCVCVCAQCNPIIRFRARELGKSIVCASSKVAVQNVHG